MDASLKPILRSISLALRHELEGWRDEQNAWQPGDLERRLNELGVWSDRPSKPLDEMRHLSAEDRAARVVVDGYLQLRSEAGVGRASAFSEFVRESAYTWANRLLALRCMEARGIIDEVILQKAVYSGRSLVHQRFLRKNPEAATGEDDGLFAVLFAEFTDRSAELPALFDPHSAAVALRPSAAALKRCIALLSGTEVVRGQDPASDEVFAASDAFGWAYQYWNTEEKSRVFEAVRTKKGTKIEGADIIPATQLYTEPYMVKFLIQNSLGALWMSLNPDSRLCESWEYYVKDADRAPVNALAANRSVREFTILDPALGSGHFHLEAFDLLLAMYQEENAELSPREIAASILNNNLFGIDLDERAIQIAEAALWMKAKAVAPDLEASDLNSFHEHLVATNIRLPRGRNHLEAFLKEHPEDSPLRPALERVFQGLEHADELGSLLQIEEPVDHELRLLKQEADGANVTPPVQGEIFEPTVVQSSLPLGTESYEEWKINTLERLKTHFQQEAEASDAVRAFFGASARKGLALFDLFARRYDVAAANPPYLTSRNMGGTQKRFLFREYPTAKRDLYSCFIHRSLRFVGENGRIAMVTMQSWTFQSAFSAFRQSLLRSQSFELMARLGSGAFEEIGGQVVAVTLFVLRRSAPRRDQRLLGISCVAPATPKLKSEQLRCAASSGGHVSVTAQSDFLNVPAAAIIFWISRGLRRALASPTRLALVATAKQGACTSNDIRFLRNWWETSGLRQARWLSFAKGGQFCRWWGNQTLRIDWAYNGSKVKTFTESLYGGTHWSVNIKNADSYFQPGWTYGLITSGSMSLRRLPEGSVFGHKGPAVFATAADEFAVAAFLNSNLATFFLRQIAPSYSFETGSILSLPWAPELDSPALRILGRIATELGRRRCESRILEPEFVLPNKGASFLSATIDATAAAMLVVQAMIEREVARALKLEPEDIRAVESDVGCPLALLPGFPLPDNILAVLESNGTKTHAAIDQMNALLDAVSPAQVEPKFTTDLQREFESGPGTVMSEAAGDEFEDLEEIDEDDEQEAAASMPTPPESFIEEMGRRLGANPLLIRSLLRTDSVATTWKCLLEEKRLNEDRMTVLVLRMLGHRWPKQIEDGEPLPNWADVDGVIPVSTGSSEPTLAARVYERLGTEFPGGNPAAICTEFEAIVGIPVGAWLAGGFFIRHITQFKKRPIVWQIQSKPQRLSGRRRSASNREPIFACLLYYHRLDADLLPKLRSQYLGVLKIAFDTEHRTLESLKQPTPEQLARKAELDVLLEELNQFDAQLQLVVESGFGPAVLLPRLRQLAVDDAMLSMKARWLARLAELLQNGEPKGADSALQEWQQAASELDHHEEFADWIANAVAHLPHHCATAGVKSLDVSEVPDDPTPATLAELICSKAEAMTETALTCLCAEWCKQHEIHVIRPLKDLIATATTQLDQLAAELESMDRRDVVRVETITREQKRLKADVKLWKKEIKDKTDAVNALAARIRHWTSPAPSAWESWLASTALFDEISSLDGRRPAPTTIRDFVQQESLYAPDLNDGVRVNIAPLQRAGLLAAEVLAAKDLDKAIADRAEWRADERRWVREGKLPQPGWWQQQNEEVSA
jgi:hypothetical protein